nr:TraX family protein [Streptococcus urinalis]
MLFTLFLGLLSMIVIASRINPFFKSFLLLVLFFCSFLFDWVPFGIPIILAFYFYHGNQKAIRNTILIACFIMIWLFISAKPLDDLTVLDWIDVISSFGLLPVIYLLNHYNGQRGLNSPVIIWGFYAFYPLHLTVLYLI